MAASVPVYRKLRTWLWVAAGIALLAASMVAREFLQQMRQVQSYAVLQTMRDVAERMSADQRTTDGLRSALQNVAGGRDAWGNDVQVFVKERAGKASYVLVSYGADGSSDARNTDEYFSMRSTDIRDDPRKDIVVRDGELVTFAGK